MGDYATAAEVKADINITSATWDATLNRMIDGAERNINRYCNRPDGFVADAVASARRYVGTGSPYIYIDEYIAVTTVEVKDSATDDTYETWAATDYVTFSGDYRWPDFNSLPYTGLLVDATGDESRFTSGAYLTRGGFRPDIDIVRGQYTVRITARWGYSATVPDDIKLATIMQSARWFKRLQGSMGDTLATSQLGTLMFRLQLDPDIKHLLADGRYVKPAVGRRP